MRPRRRGGTPDLWFGHEICHGVWKRHFEIDAEQALRNYAAAAGKDLESVVLDAVREKIAAEEMSTTVRDVAAWAERFDRWVESHPAITHFADDSRESIC